MVGIDWRLSNKFATVAVAIIFVCATLFGLVITQHHRSVERGKFENIIAIEKRLRLQDSGLFTKVKVPDLIKWLDVVNPKKSNTMLFISRMHIGLLLFGIIYLVVTAFRK